MPRCNGMRTFGVSIMIRMSELKIIRTMKVIIFQETRKTKKGEELLRVAIQTKNRIGVGKRVAIHELGFLTMLSIDSSFSSEVHFRKLVKMIMRQNAIYGTKLKLYVEKSVDAICIRCEPFGWCKLLRPYRGGRFLSYRGVQKG